MPCLGHKFVLITRFQGDGKCAERKVTKTFQHCFSFFICHRQPLCNSCNDSIDKWTP